MRRFALLGVWTAATAVAVAVTWGGVQLVARQVVDPIPVALTGVERSPAPTPSEATPPASIPEATPGASAAPPVADPSPAETAEAAEETEESVEAETRTYQLQGGTVSVSFSPSEVTVVQATPRTGYSRKVEPEGAGIKVEFRSDAHRSRLEAWWDGEPQVATREDARD